jgi:hypothetical protein
VRAPPDRFSEKSVFELIPKGKLLAAVSLLVVLFAVVYVQRNSDRAMQRMRGLVAPSAAAPAQGVRSVRLAPGPGPGGQAP